MSTGHPTSEFHPSPDLPAIAPSPPTPDAEGFGVRPKRWTRQEYHRLGEQGWFNGRRVELIDGEIMEVSPQSHEHYWVIENLRQLLESSFGGDFWIRTQGPITPSDHSEPEPDIAVVAGAFDTHLDHPSDALLAVEVSKTTRNFDKGVKADLYASAKIEDYWVLDLVRRELTLFRKPVEGAESKFGWRYAAMEVVGAGGVVSPLAAPGETFKVADMLPPETPSKKS